jgi:hypothetical protein
MVGPVATEPLLLALFLFVFVFFGLFRLGARLRAARERSLRVPLSVPPALRFCRITYRKHGEKPERRLPARGAVG